MNFDIETAEGKCHCGKVRFRVRLKNGLHSARRCDCSLCRMRGAVAVSADAAELTILEGADALSLYQFNTKTARHYFCSNCGIYTHHQRRSNPSEYGVNLACLEDISPFDFETVPVMDGVHHPSDGKSSGIVGYLKFSRSA